MNIITIFSKKRKLDKLQREHPNAEIIDITSHGEGKAQLLSPFYPHGNIPIPFTKGITATCVEAVWQGLKVFASEGVNLATFQNDTMKNLKRTVRSLGAPLGHQKGLNSTELLDYITARKLIYLPTYKWVLENVKPVREYLKELRQKAEDHELIFLDYNTNIDYLDPKKPLSHAGLVKLYLEGRYPGFDATPKAPQKESERRHSKTEQGSLL